MKAWSTHGRFHRYRLTSIFSHIMADVNRGAWTYPPNSGLNALANPLSLLKRCSDAIGTAQVQGGKVASINWESAVRP